MDQLLFGREISMKEWPSESDIPGTALIRPAFLRINNAWQCQRCGTHDEAMFIMGPCTCGTDCFYCSVCLNMGKLKKCTHLYSLPETNAFNKLSETPLVWEGVLSPEQQRASEAIVKTWYQKEIRLIWAVAGSGKTEMIFQGIARCLLAQGRVCIASPRIDVCLELAPRLQAAFRDIPIALLYGGMEEVYHYTPLTIATTHQLLRFKEAFDLLIIDEVDSFPYHNNLALHFGAEKARKHNSALLYLTATPPRMMQLQVKKGELPATVLPARYHGYPLPEVTTKWLGDWRKAIRKRQRRSPLIKLIDKAVHQKRRFLLFLPHIGLMLELEKWLHDLYPEMTFTSVSAEDPERVKKVKEMREEKYTLLLTTTILERGVTFRDIDVLVIGAEDRVFTEASLVQIAGRAGRHRDFPTGMVWFGHYGKTKAIKHAVSQIKTMNQQAREKGLLHGTLPDL
ncbi:MULTISPECIES: DEAD/DEAH box helicase [unclassified Jeotgalibaca]|uniref:DEAD/DEAH box helicase n=1 Tax=unclassified Jeotgalibaca TaxID=2621505 RepID=UPI003FD59833